MSALNRQWSKGEGVIQHKSQTIERIEQLTAELDAWELCDRELAAVLFRAADILCNMALWLTVHMTYAKNVYLDGRPLSASDFKLSPKGHTGGALNEAFAVKMLGAMRQEIVFSRRLAESGRTANWISVPVILTSHTWENSKNEQSHQDPTLCAAWLQEMSDVAPVYFPFDANTAVRCLSHIYSSCGKVAAVVILKNKVPIETTNLEAETAVHNGARLLAHDKDTRIQLIAIGAYQLQQVQTAARRLRDNGIGVSVIAMIEPGKFRSPRDAMEATCVGDPARQLPECALRIVVCHTHAEVMTGVLRKLDTGADSTRFMGYRNKGGTLDVFGMLYANKQSWLHIVHEAVLLLKDVKLNVLLGTEEMAALQGEASGETMRRLREV